MTVIKIKNSSVVGKSPAAGDLQVAELALNTADKKLYSKDTNGNIFQIGADGEVPSGGTGDRPDSPTIGDLFYDTDLNLLLYWNGSSWEEVGGGSEVIVSDTPPGVTDLEEGTLWWNSDAGDLSLYVLYDDANPDGRLKWIEASPMPGAADIDGYPNIGDGNGETLDDRYVSKTVADHKVGDLTIGPDAGTDNITLAADGTGTFAGDIVAGVDGGSPRVQIKASSAYVRALRADGKQALLSGSAVNGLSITDNGDPKVELGWDGSATFAGTVEFSNNGATGGTVDGVALTAGCYAGAANANAGSIKIQHNDFHGDTPFALQVLRVPSNQETVRISPSGSATFSSSVTSGHNNTTYGTSIHPWGGVVATRSNTQTGDNHYVFRGYSGSNTDDNNKTSEILANGTATFAGTIEYGQNGFIGNGALSTLTGGANNVYGTIVGVKPGATASVARNFYVYLNSASNSPSREVFRIDGIGDADAHFRGTVHQNGLRTGEAIIELERDDPANYTTTTDAEGNETQVYNGPTLDVKERLQAAHETFQELQVAVQNATDFGELKAAMLVALEDYA